MQRSKARAAQRKKARPRAAPRLTIKVVETLLPQVLTGIWMASSLARGAVMRKIGPRRQQENLQSLRSVDTSDKDWAKAIRFGHLYLPAFAERMRSCPTLPIIPVKVPHFRPARTALSMLGNLCSFVYHLGKEFGEPDDFDESIGPAIARLSKLGWDEFDELQMRAEGELMLFARYRGRGRPGRRSRLPRRQDPATPLLDTQQLPARVLVTLLDAGTPLTKQDLNRMLVGPDAKSNPRLANLLTPKGELARRGFVEVSRSTVTLTLDGQAEARMQRDGGTLALGMRTHDRLTVSEE